MLGKRGGNKSNSTNACYVSLLLRREMQCVFEALLKCASLDPSFVADTWDPKKHSVLKVN